MDGVRVCVCVCVCVGVCVCVCVCVCALSADLYPRVRTWTVTRTDRLVSTLHSSPHFPGRGPKFSNEAKRSGQLDQGAEVR